MSTEAGQLQFTQALVEQHGTLLVPGWVFGAPGNHFRVGLGRANLPAALDRLSAFTDQRGWERGTPSPAASTVAAR